MSAACAVSTVAQSQTAITQAVSLQQEIMLTSAVCAAETMAQLQFEITNQVIKRTDTFRVVADSKDYLYAKFTILTDDWGDGQKTAIFIQDENSYRVLLDANGECLVPWEVLINNAVVRVSVFSGTRVTANYAQIFVEESGYVDNAIYPDNPTPTVYEEIIAMIDDAVEEAKTAAEADAEAAAGSAASAL